MRRDDDWSRSRSSCPSSHIRHGHKHRARSERNRRCRLRTPIRNTTTYEHDSGNTEIAVIEAIIYIVYTRRVRTGASQVFVHLQRGTAGGAVRKELRDDADSTRSDEAGIKVQCDGSVYKTLIRALTIEELRDLAGLVLRLYGEEEEEEEEEEEDAESMTRIKRGHSVRRESGVKKKISA